jgi:hypothetical protein
MGAFERLTPDLSEVFTGQLNFQRAKFSLLLQGTQRSAKTVVKPDATR